MAAEVAPKAVTEATQAEGAVAVADLVAGAEVVPTEAPLAKERLGWAVGSVMARVAIREERSAEAVLVEDAEDSDVAPGPPEA